MNSELPLGTFFGYGLLGSAIMYFAWVLSVKAVYAISKAEAPFQMILNMTAASILPSALTCAAAIIISFIWAPLAVLLLAVGSIANLLMIYHGVTTSVQLPKNPFWLFLAAYAACTIVLYFVVTQLTSAAFSSMLDGMGFNLLDMLW